MAFSALYVVIFALTFKAKGQMFYPYEPIPGQLLPRRAGEILPIYMKNIHHQQCLAAFNASTYTVLNCDPTNLNLIWHMKFNGDHDHDLGSSFFQLSLPRMSNLCICGGPVLCPCIANGDMFNAWNQLWIKRTFPDNPTFYELSNVHGQCLRLMATNGQSLGVTVEHCAMSFQDLHQRALLWGSSI